MNARKLEGTIRSYLSMAPPATMIMSDEAYYARTGGEMAPVEITGGEPHVVGGHGLSGYWVDERRRTTIDGLWAAGDVAGGVPKKYATGAWAEGVIAMRDMIEHARTQPSAPELDAEHVVAERARVFAPLAGGDGVSCTDLGAPRRSWTSTQAASALRHERGRALTARLHPSGSSTVGPTRRRPARADALRVVERVTVAKVLVEHAPSPQTRWHCPGA